MKVLKIILIIIAFLVVALIATYAYYGGFKKVKVIETIVPEISIVYEELRGDYSQTAEATDRIYHDLLNNENIETIEGIGIFYDDPKKVDKDQLRFEAGCVLPGITSEKLEELKLKYNIKTIPAGTYVTSEFPFRGIVSIMTGIMKVYPAIGKFQENNNLATNNPIMEIYNVPEKRITYRTLAVKKQ